MPKSKRSKPGDEKDEAEMIAEEGEETGGAQGESDPDFDITSIHEVVLTSVRATLGACKSKEGGEEAGQIDNMIEKLIPLMATAVSVAIGETMRTIVMGMDRRSRASARSKSPTRNEERLLRAVTVLTYQNDRLEQYSRRESVRVFGIPSDEGETTEALERKVIGVFKDTGSDVRPEDISVLHRAGSRQNAGPRPVLVPFVSRKKRREVMTKKKVLKDKEKYKKVFINDDLTPLRSKLLGMVKKLDAVDRAWTLEGRIFCTKKRQPGSSQDRASPIVIENPDDLFKLGVDEVDFELLGLSHLSMSA